MNIGSNVGIQGAALPRITAVFEGVVIAQRCTTLAWSLLLWFAQDSLLHALSAGLLFFAKSEFNSPVLGISA